MAAFAKSWRFTRMFRFFSGPRRAQQIAYSIGQLIHMLSAGRENHGLESPERLLRGLGPLVNEDTISGQPRALLAAGAFAQGNHIGCE